MIYWLALLSVAWLPSVATAQVVTSAVAGTVTDARSGQPIPDSRVELSDLLQTILTDADGRFRFEDVPSGIHTIVVSRVGYALEARRVDVGAEGLEITVALVEGAAAFSERVTIQGSPFGPRELGIAGQQSLSSGELRQLGGMTLDDPLRAVQTLAGASASDDLAGEFSVRGNGFHELSYTLDGMPARYLLHSIKRYEDGGSVAMLNSDVLDHVSLLRGAYPQRFDQRLGAGLAFVSSDGSRERTRVNVTASGTSASATVDGPLIGSRGAWIVSGRRSYLDVFLRRVLNDSSLAFGFGDVFSKVTFDVSSRDQLQVSLVAGHSRFQSEGATSAADLGAATHDGWLTSLTWRRTLSPAVTLTQRVFLTGESYDNRGGTGQHAASGDNRDVGYRMDAIVASTSGRVVEGGWSVERLFESEIRVDRAPGWQVYGGESFDKAAVKAAAYGQVGWSIGRFTVAPGARAERFGVLGRVDVSPWLQTELRAFRGVTVRAGASVSHQWPDLDQVVGRRGAPTLRASSARHVDGGFEGVVGSTTRWQLTLYRRDEANIVDLPDQYVRRLENDVFQPSASSRYVNGLRVASHGVEALLQRKTSIFSGWVAYAFSRTRTLEKATGTWFDSDYDQRHTVSVFARYRMADRTSVNARFRYGSNRPIVGYVTADNGQYAIGSIRNGARVPPYARFDARVDRTYRWGTKRLTVFGEVANLLNHANVRQIPASIDVTTGRLVDPFRPMFPILPSVGLTLEF